MTAPMIAVTASRPRAGGDHDRRPVLAAELFFHPVAYGMLLVIGQEIPQATLDRVSKGRKGQ
jgi:hypothetical protein